MKVYIYCTKAKPYLRDYRGKAIFNRFVLSPEAKPYTSDDVQPILNGKVIACFDLNKVEKMGLDTNNGLVFDCGFNKESQLSLQEIVNYVGDNYYYAWHIDNLQVLNKPLELNGYSDLFLCDKDKNNRWEQVRKAPQSWHFVRNIDDELCILISIKPEWVEKILNGKKTIEVRKTAPKI